MAKLIYLVSSVLFRHRPVCVCMCVNDVVLTKICSSKKLQTMENKPGIKFFNTLESAIQKELSVNCKPERPKPSHTRECHTPLIFGDNLTAGMQIPCDMYPSHMPSLVTFVSWSFLYYLIQIKVCFFCLAQSNHKKCP